MRFKSRNKLDKTVWHEWFAWHPVRVISGDVVWLETVLRHGRRELIANGDGQPEYVWDWQYQA